MGITIANLDQQGSEGGTQFMTEKVTSAMLDFLKTNVLNISEVTRTNKLTEILDMFSARKSEQVFVVQNSKKKGAQGVFVDMEYFQELLLYKQAVEDARDAIVYQTALERKDDTAEISLSSIVAENDLNIEEIMQLVGKVEIE